MQMTANFLQPKGGITDRDEEMVFEFNGDDDMWVYINDVLILDIGGEHDAHSGTINFVTGVVTVNISATQTVTTSLNKLYEDAEVFPDGSDWNEEKINDYFVDTGKRDSAGDPIYRFKDYEKYTMKMFYMERGTGASNLHIRFNLQTVPDGAVTVAKELSNTDKEKYANEDFQFELYVQEKADDWTDTNPSYKDEYVQVTSTNMDSLGITANLRQNGVSTGTELRWSENKFLLKPDQSVEFSGLKANQKYYVKEVGVENDRYDGIKINSTTVVGVDEDGNPINESTETPGEDGKIDVSSSKASVSERSSVTFINNCSEANHRELRITKKMVDGQSTEDTFTFQIQLESSASKEEISWADYVGNYYLTDESGNYYYYDKEKLTSNGKEPIVCGTTDEEGKVSGIPVGYTVSITGLLSGTAFKVVEINPNTGLATAVYNAPTYQITNESAENPKTTDDGASGTIILGKDALVTVTNSLKLQISVSKEWIGVQPKKEQRFMLGCIKMASHTIIIR